MTLVEGYPSRTSEAGGLLVDQYLRPAKSQQRWYGICPGQKCEPPAVASWNVAASKINSSYSRIARKAGMAATQDISGHSQTVGTDGQGSHSNLQSDG